MVGLGVRGAALAAAAGTSGVHIDATLFVINDGPGSPPGSSRSQSLSPVIHFNINIEVWGSESDVSGFGWGALADADDLTRPARVDATQGFTQRGSVVGDVVTLKGADAVLAHPRGCRGPDRHRGQPGDRPHPRLRQQYGHHRVSSRVPAS